MQLLLDPPLWCQRQAIYAFCSDDISHFGYRNVLHIMYALSRWAEVFACRKIDAAAATKCLLREVTRDLGSPGNYPVTTVLIALVTSLKMFEKHNRWVNISIVDPIHSQRFESRM